MPLHERSRHHRSNLVLRIGILGFTILVFPLVESQFVRVCIVRHEIKWLAKFHGDITALFVVCKSNKAIVML